MVALLCGPVLTEAWMKASAGGRDVPPLLEEDMPPEPLPLPDPPLDEDAESFAPASLFPPLLIDPPEQPAEKPMATANAVSPESDRFICALLQSAATFTTFIRPEPDEMTSSDHRSPSRFSRRTYFVTFMMADEPPLNP